MAPPIPPYILIATSLGLSLSTTFSIGSLALSYLAIPAILLPPNAPLMPPLELVTEAKKRHFRTEPAPKQPLDSGIGDEDESILESGATSRVLSKSNNRKNGSPSSTSYLLRQWFHLFSKGMHTFPPFALGSAACYTFCAVMLPGPLDVRGPMVVKRGLYVLAGMLSAGIMVFTLTALKPVNEALHERVKEVMAIEKESREDAEHKRVDTEGLIRQWGRMNALRAILPILAIVSAVAAMSV